MRTASLLVLLLAAPLLWAQDNSSAPPPQPAPAAQPAPQAAPQPGHPLDPADVATLTGRSSSPTAPVSPYYLPYQGGYTMNVPLFGGSQFASSRNFGPWHGGNFFFFGAGGFHVPLFTPIVRHHGGHNVFMGFRPHR